MSGRWCAAACLSALLTAWPPPAAAQPYDVVPGCPTQQAWMKGLQARLPMPLSAGALQRFSVSIQRDLTSSGDPERYTGQLLVVGAPASEARSVSGSSCQDVVAALSLVAALALRRQPAPPVLGSSVPELELNAQQTRLASEDSLSGASAAHDLEQLRIGLTGFVLLQSITAPRLATDLGLGVALSWRTEHWQPWLLLGAYWGGEEIRVSDGSAGARFDRWATHVVGCPLRFPRQSVLGLRPCLNLDLGRLSGRGLRVSAASRSASLLASSGLELRFEWSVLEHFELSAEFGMVVPLARPRFFFSPDFIALELPALSFRSGATASLSF